jgi:hypothetical protein
LFLCDLALTLANFAFGFVGKPSIASMRCCAHLLVHDFQTNREKVIEFRMIFVSEN